MTSTCEVISRIVPRLTFPMLIASANMQSKYKSTDEDIAPNAVSHPMWVTKFHSPTSRSFMSSGEAGVLCIATTKAKSGT